MRSTPAPRLRAAVNGLYYLLAVVFFLYLFSYYLTGEGGPTVLAVMLVPVAFVLFVLDELRNDVSTQTSAGSPTTRSPPSTSRSP